MLYLKDYFERLAKQGKKPTEAALRYYSHKDLGNSAEAQASIQAGMFEDLDFSDRMPDELKDFERPCLPTGMKPFRFWEDGEHSSRSEPSAGPTKGRDGP